MISASPIPAPFVSEGLRVKPEWIDSNGHMNIAYYVLAFDETVGPLFDAIGLEWGRVPGATGSTFTAELHVTYQRELREGDPIRVTSQLLGYDAKRCHLLQCLYHAGEGFLAATQEWLMLYVDMTERRVTAMPPAMRERLAAIRAAHADLPVPPVVGRGIALANRRPAL
jgi:acyl-CoA thioester hydrolase